MNTGAAEIHNELCVAYSQNMCEGTVKTMAYIVQK
jgi:hypothetical protein